MLNLTVLRVNVEIWNQLTNFKRKKGLWFSSINRPYKRLPSPSYNVAIISPLKLTWLKKHYIIALIGHTTGELSHLCREQIKPVSKLEFHSFCTSANKSMGHTFGSPLWSRLSQTNLSHQRRNRHWPKDKHVHHKHVKKFLSFLSPQW